ncbi:rare lipoprotein A [Sphingobium sp. OAS761]|uniref:septal ring lytic transglycosylase RlpA family protein n=1 Tax=Sphingobium sp. OAS761 TaxID=2817901 RepID=UPI00209C9E7F|nr:RlpA-like double-psi beta-barrel domain-containing protein [Sphingobium sp. OAS761]MCP1471108.1 rare lipoprotein A [Sphingobium sp. OAS761]
MPSNNRVFSLAALVALSASGTPSMAQTATQPVSMVADTPVVLGAPYSVGGVTYRPADPPYYDETGYAGRYEHGSQDGTTVNGEAYEATAIAGAHKTLPVPSYVEVTSLDSGRTILVRVNDRGPMRNDQIIALSPGAIAQLGAKGDPFPVRVRRVSPPDQERVVLRSNGRAAERLETPAALLAVLRGKLPAGTSPVATGKTGTAVKAAAAPPKTSTAPRAGADFDGKAAPAPLHRASSPAPAKSSPDGGTYVVQVGAFSSQARAQALARRAGAHVEQNGALWRVRLGPYATLDAAKAGARSAAAKGFENGRIMAKDAN